MGDPENLSISEVAEASGLPTSALRYYEREGLIASVGRASGRRQFDPSVLERLAAISLLQEAGFTIAEMVLLLEHGAGRRRWRPMAEEKLREIDAHLARVEEAKALLIAALRCECDGLDTCELVADRRGLHRRIVQRLSSATG